MSRKLSKSLLVLLSVGYGRNQENAFKNLLTSTLCDQNYLWERKD